ncbi:hypothetical protein J1N35_013907, partial [Gossypium stocksii]
MANLWNLIRGISISDLGKRRFLFHFYIEMDIVQVIQGNPWTFINHLLMFHRLEKGEDHLKVSLCFVDFWVQVHDIPVVFYNEQLARQFETFLDIFLDYDSKALAFGLKKILWHKKRTALFLHQYFYARFQYKRLTLFCFICGKLGY